MKVIVGHCIRCGAVPELLLDLGKFGMVPMCPVCWTGLATCMKKDLALWETNPYWRLEFKKALDMHEAIDENIQKEQEKIREKSKMDRVNRALDALKCVYQ